MRAASAGNELLYVSAKMRLVKLNLADEFRPFVNTGARIFAVVLGLLRTCRKVEDLLFYKYRTVEA